jgi:hypothetical protein
MKRRGVLTVMAGSMVLALPGCGAFGRDLPDYRYRLTVEVETPEGLKTGSSVIEVHTAKASRYSIPTPGAISYRFRGEAVAVELGSRGTLFALLRSPDENDWPAQVMFLLTRYSEEGGDAGFRKTYDAMLANRNAITLPQTFPDVGHLRNRKARPMLVRFRDIADPKTVESVDPDNLTSTFGKGVKLKRITVQLTDDEVTKGIEKRLVWLLNQRGSLIPIPSGTPIGEMPIGSDITEGDFVRSTM